MHPAMVVDVAEFEALRAFLVAAVAVSSDAAEASQGAFMATFEAAKDTVDHTASMLEDTASLQRDAQTHSFYQMSYLSSRAANALIEKKLTIQSLNLLALTRW